MTQENQNNETLPVVNDVVSSDDIVTPQIASDKDFDRTLKIIKSSGLRFRESVQDAAMYALLKAMVQDNFDPANRLMLAVIESTSARNQAQLQLWFQTFGPFAWRKTDDMRYPDGKKFRKDTSESANPFDADSAFNKPWYTVEGTTAEEDAAVLKKLFGSDTAIDKAKKIIKDITKNLEKGTMANPDLDVLVMPVFAEKLQLLINETERELNALTAPQAA